MVTYAFFQKTRASARREACRSLLCTPAFPVTLKFASRKKKVFLPSPREFSMRHMGACVCADCTQTPPRLHPPPAAVPCALEGQGCTDGLRVLDGARGERFCRHHFRALRDMEHFGRVVRPDDHTTLAITLNYLSPHVDHEAQPKEPLVVFHHGCVRTAPCLMCPTSLPPTRAFYDEFSQGWMCDNHFKSLNEV